MSWWPWSRRETRATQPFTDAIVSAIASQAAGTTAGDPSAIAALEACAGIWSRAFAAATVEPAHPAITPAVLALIARDLIRRGESVFAIEVDGAAPVLRPAGSWDVRGPWREDEWHLSRRPVRAVRECHPIRAVRRRRARALQRRPIAAVAWTRAARLGAAYRHLGGEPGTDGFPRKPGAASPD